MQPRSVILQPRPITLVENSWRHKNEQVALMSFVVVTLKRIAEERNVPKKRHLCPRFGYLIGKQAADCERVAAFDQDAGIERARVNNRAGHVCATKYKVKICDLVTDFWFYGKRDEIVF